MGHRRRASAGKSGAPEQLAPYHLFGAPPSRRPPPNSAGLLIGGSQVEVAVIRPEASCASSFLLANVLNILIQPWVFRGTPAQPERNRAMDLLDAVQA
jgi:hypothetical protein